MLDIIKNPQHAIIIQESHELPSLAIGEDEIKIHEGDRNLIQGICSEGEGEVSHENKEKYVAEMEDIIEILIGEDFSIKERCVHSLHTTISDVDKQSREIRNTLDIIERVPTNGCSSFSETYHNEVFPPLYVGDYRNSKSLMA